MRSTTKRQLAQRKLERTEFVSEKGIARFWNEDGMWHIARPAPDPDPKTGLHNGGFQYTFEEFAERDDAIRALDLPF